MKMKHGTLSMYTNAHCKCALCAEASAEYQRNIRARRKQARAKLVSVWRGDEFLTTMIIHNGDVTNTAMITKLREAGFTVTEER